MGVLLSKDKGPTAKLEWVAAYEFILNQADYPDYVLIDLNKCGIPELVLSARSEYEGLNIYKDGKVKNCGGFDFNWGFGVDKYISKDGKKIGTTIEVSIGADDPPEIVNHWFAEYELYHHLLITTGFASRDFSGRNGRITFERLRGETSNNITEQEFLELQKKFYQNYTREFILHEYVPGEDITKYWIK